MKNKSTDYNKIHKKPAKNTTKSTTQKPVYFSSKMSNFDEDLLENVLGIGSDMNMSSDTLKPEPENLGTLGTQNSTSSVVKSIADNTLMNALRGNQIHTEIHTFDDPRQAVEKNSSNESSGGSSTVETENVTNNSDLLNNILNSRDLNRDFTGNLNLNQHGMNGMGRSELNGSSLGGSNLNADNLNAAVAQVIRDGLINQFKTPSEQRQPDQFHKQNSTHSSQIQATFYFQMFIF